MSTECVQLLDRSKIPNFQSGTHQARGFTLHTVQYTQGQDLKWSDISSYLRLLGERLLPDHASDMVEDFYTTIYSQIICVSIK